MMNRVAVLLGVSMLPAMGGDWNPRAAANYLDARQKEWFAWPTANSGAKPCISCHTGLTYLLARPALRKRLGEKEPTLYETGLVESLRSRVDKRAPDTPGLGVESVMAALFVRTPAAMDRMWALQIREGNGAGAWKWFSLDLDPWEEPESELFGAALAAMAVGSAPAEYRKQPEVQARVASLTAYLRGPHEHRPLHNWLAVAWASSKLPDAMEEKERRAVIREAYDKQGADGGWSMESLGPFKGHPNAPAAAPGSSAYATAFATLALMKSGASSAEPRISRALEWLRAHQDREGGYWNADSMNKQFKPDSMEIRFMRDAATGFASLALLEAGDAERVK
jgi:squalene-hopene/tetraprenyl-beta-curcumene cyclase